MIQIYHNNRCGKSRNCLAFLEKSTLEFETINYLVDAPTFDQLTTIIRKLKIEPLDLVRKKEIIWLEKYKLKIMSDNEIIQAMIDNPLLIERPILIFNDKAIIARDLDKLANFL